MAESELVAGALMEMVAPFAPVVCEREIGLTPRARSRARDARITSGVPSGETPPENPPPPPPMMESVPPFAPVVCESVMLFEPTSTSCVPVIPVAPAVFPRLEAPALIAPAPRLGAEMVSVVAPAAVP